MKLLALTLAIVTVLAGPAAAAPMPTAHRGTHTTCGYTENTYRAIRRCAAAAEAVEVDMRLSSDGRPVFIHDATLDRTTRATGPVANRTFKQLRSIVTEDGVGRIPSTAVIRNIIADTDQLVFIDVKVYPRARGWDILEQLPRSNVLFFSARNNDYIRAAEGHGYRAAHFTWPDEPAPTVAEVRKYGDVVWRSAMTNTQAARYRDAGIARVGGGNTVTEWERLASQGAWATATDRLPAYLMWLYPG